VIQALEDLAGLLDCIDVCLPHQEVRNRVGGSSLHLFLQHLLHILFQNCAACDFLDADVKQQPLGNVFHVLSVHVRVKTSKLSILKFEICLESLVQLSKPSVVKLSNLLGNLKILVVEKFLG
jgi:hypothetical protein